MNVSSLNACNSSNEMCVIDHADEEVEAQVVWAAWREIAGNGTEGSHPCFHNHAVCNPAGVCATERDCLRDAFIAIPFTLHFLDILIQR